LATPQGGSFIVPLDLKMLIIYTPLTIAPDGLSEGHSIFYIHTPQKGAERCTEFFMKNLGGSLKTEYQFVSNSVAEFGMKQCKIRWN
jgi:hypothetical protein